MKPSKSLRTDVLPRWLESLSPNLRITWEFLTPEQQAAVFKEYQAIVAESFESPRKFALRAFREHNPDEVLNKPDVALLRGVGVKRLDSVEEQERRDQSTPKTA